MPAKIVNYYLGSIAGGNHVKTSGISMANSGCLAKTQLLAIRNKARARNNRDLSVCAEYKYEIPS